MCPKIGYPQIIHFNRIFHYKPSILWVPLFWKHPYICTWYPTDLLFRGLTGTILLPCIGSCLNTGVQWRMKFFFFARAPTKVVTKIFPTVFHGFGRPQINPNHISTCTNHTSICTDDIYVYLIIYIYLYVHMYMRWQEVIFSSQNAGQQMAKIL